MSSFSIIFIILIAIFIVGIPFFLIGIIIKKICKYLDIKTEYYKKHIDDRQV